MKLIVGISGASGVIYGVEMLKACKELEVETHLIISKWGTRNLNIETNYNLQEVEALASYTYENKDLTGLVSSGSFKHDGMVIIPCSMKTLSAVACGYADTLLDRAADVTLKESRKLIIVPRETPLNSIHIENMLKLSRIGVVIMPPMPAMYPKPQSIRDIILHTVSRVLDQLEIENEFVPRWQGE